MCSSCHLFVSHSIRSWEVAQTIRTKRQAFRNKQHHQEPHAEYVPSQFGCPPLSPISPAYATCVHSFSFPFFPLPPLSLQIPKNSLTTQTSGFLIATVGNLLVHMPHVWKQNPPHSSMAHSENCPWSYIVRQRQGFRYSESERAQ